MISAVEKFYITALGLVALYLLLMHASQANTILQGIANFNVGTFGVLQGRSVSGGGFSVSQ